jgi:hypothetical protein
MFSRLDYDMGGYKAEIAQSMRPMEFVLDKNYWINKEDEYNKAPGFLGNDIGQIGFYDPKDKIDVDNRPMIDIEYDLTRRDIKLSKDPHAQYEPPCHDPNSLGYPAGDGYYTTCVKGKGLKFVQDSRTYTTYPRVINPPNTLKGTGVNRFEFPPLEPQDPRRWKYEWKPSDGELVKPTNEGIIDRKGTNSRNFVKDMWQGKEGYVYDNTQISGAYLGFEAEYEEVNN